MSIIFSSLFLIILTTNLYSIGFIFLNEKKNNLGLAPNILFGFTILILLSNFLFFIFYLNSLKIFYIVFVLSTIISIYCFFKIKYFYLNKLKYLILFSLPIIFFYIFLATIYGEQYYVFRGNKWDWFALVTSSVYLNTINTHDFLELSKNFNWETVNNFETNQLSAYHQNIKIWLLRKVNLYLLGSLFQNLNFNSPFLNLYLLKIFSIILINFSIYDFFKNFFTRVIIK